MNPIWQQKELREFCKTKGIHIIAYSPLGAYNTIWGDNRVMECDVLNEIAKSKGKTTAQVISCLCFHLIVGSFFLSVRFYLEYYFNYNLIFLYLCSF